MEIKPTFSKITWQWSKYEQEKKCLQNSRYSLVKETIIHDTTSLNCSFGSWSSYEITKIIQRKEK